MFLDQSDWPNAAAALCEFLTEDLEKEPFLCLSLAWTYPSSSQCFFVHASRPLAIVPTTCMHMCLLREQVQQVLKPSDVQSANHLLEMANLVLVVWKDAFILSVPPRGESCPGLIWFVCIFVTQVVFGGDCWGDNNDRISFPVPAVIEMTLCLRTGCHCIRRSCPLAAISNLRWLLLVMKQMKWNLVAQPVHLLNLPVPQVTRGCHRRLLLPRKILGSDLRVLLGCFVQLHSNYSFSLSVFYSVLISAKCQGVMNVWMYEYGMAWYVSCVV